VGLHCPGYGCEIYGDLQPEIRKQIDHDDGVVLSRPNNGGGILETKGLSKGNHCNERGVHERLGICDELVHCSCLGLGVLGID